MLSVPFSSGFALRRGGGPGRRAEERAFQFPFPRDSLCDLEKVLRKPQRWALSVPFSSGFALRLLKKMRSIRGIRVFQFPFPRDSLCDGLETHHSRHRAALSVPFSSGFALRPPRGEVLRFQFPFPRDSLCDRKILRAGIHLGYTFSSLFLGIRFATREKSCNVCVC